MKYSIVNRFYCISRKYYWKIFGKVNKNHFGEIKFGNSRVPLYNKTSMNS